MFGFSQSATALAFIVLLTSRPCSADPPAPDALKQTPSADTIPDSTYPTAEQIQAWVKLLGDENFQQREEATSALEKIGEPALDALEAAKLSDDAEVRDRASRLHAKIQGTLIVAAMAHLKSKGGSFTRDSNAKPFHILNVREKAITDADLQHVGRLPFLTKLLSENNADITDVGVAHLQHLKKLEHLSLGNTRITDAGILKLRNLHSLKSLSVNGCAITDASLEHLRQFENLIGLDLRGTRVSDRGLEQIGKIPNLVYLSLANTEISGKGLAAISPLKQLVALNLIGTRVADDDLAALAGMLRLEMLDLDDTQVHGPGLVHLAGCRQLTWLRLKGLALDSEAMKTLAQHPSLQRVSLERAKIDPASVTALKESSTIYSITLPRDWTVAQDQAARSALETNRAGRKIRVELDPN